MARKFRLFALTAVVALAVALGGCGSDDDESSGSPASEGGSAGLSAETQEDVDAAFEGSFEEPPSSGPKPEAGKNIWLIAWSAQFTPFTAPGHVADAAEELGWNLKIIDGKFSPEAWVSGIRQAIAAKADGIVTFIIDCAPIKAALQDAKEAGIPVVGWESIDCDQTIGKTGELVDTGEPRLFTTTITYSNPDDPDKPLTYAEFAAESNAGSQALGMIAGTEGKLKLIKLKETDLPITLLADSGFDRSLKRHCPEECEIVDTINFVAADVGAKLQEKVEQSLAQHPEANGVYGIYDGPTQNVAPAVLASGRKDDIYVMGGEGTEPLIDLVRADRGVDAGAGWSVEWEGWAAMDAMNRLLAGETPPEAGFPSGLGAQLFDRNRNLPPEGKPYQPPIDFRAAYRKAWGG